MTIDEAIRILDSSQAPPLMHPESKYNNALNLGIEALKRIKDNRENLLPFTFHKLPGETEE
jgi:hypothetical protein